MTKRMNGELDLERWAAQLERERERGREGERERERERGVECVPESRTREGRLLGDETRW